jgi:uncharacterized protein YjiK
MSYKTHVPRVLSLATAILFSHLATADNDNSISKNYHITKPENSGVNESIKLIEASALALSHRRKSLWTVSDDNEDIVFKMKLNGDAKNSESFKIINFPSGYEKDLEGVALSADGTFMYVAQEPDLAILKINVTTESDNATLIETVKLSDMAGYNEKIANIYGSIGNKKGLEGITVHTGTNEIFTLIEQVSHNSTKGPLLVKISSDLRTIIAVKFLNIDAGFVAEDGSTGIDGSGIDFDRTDASKNKFYIVSDEGERVFHYDWDDNTARSVHELGFQSGEGVVYDPDTKTLYIATDSKDNSKLHYYEKN